MGAGFDSELFLSEKSSYGLSQTMGAYVLSVTPGSPADKAGLVAADPNSGRGGDLIVVIDCQDTQNFGGLNSYLVSIPRLAKRSRSRLSGTAER